MRLPLPPASIRHEVSAGEHRREIGRIAEQGRCRPIAHPSSALLRTPGGVNVILQNGMCTDQKRGLLAAAGAGAREKEIKWKKKEIRCGSGRQSCGSE